MRYRKPEKILTGNGSDELIYLLCTAFLNPGDEAIHTEYGFLVFPQAIKIAGGVPIVAPDDNFTVSVDAIISKLTPRLTSIIKIIKTAAECIKNTKKSDGLSNDEGFIFKPIENNRSSTPISDGISNNDFPLPS